ncbi:DUF6318 family protein [Citricoccus sp. NR2]|uniref:DUF6318 family protein n=1 Tax=Citricoccus sp. NR2 TaxID=3004095 RepID=UPI0022DE65D5|nr:DUF6318 family protein [Citricoccus sp. NR2]WBL20200.1 DUF6318 family protein [Citricoccus sp. NR2]
MARTAPTVSTSRALRTVRPVRLAVVGAALSMTFALTSCSDSGGNNGDDDAASPTASSATASNTEFVPASADGPAQNVPVPEFPDAAREQTTEGAEATLEYWWEALEYLYLTGDPEPFQSVSDEGCVFCQNFIDVVPEPYTDDGWYVLENNYEIDVHQRRSSDDDNSVEFQYTVTQPATQSVDSSGNVQEEDSIDETLVDLDTVVSFTPDSAQWEVSQMVLTDE